MNDRELIQQALDAMLNFPNDISDEMFESIRSLRARLAQPDATIDGMPAYEGPLSKSQRLSQPEPEPVAWAVVSAEGKILDASWYKPCIERWLKYDATRRMIPLYTAPKIFCGCGDQIVPDDGAECGTCVTARNAVRNT